MAEKIISEFFDVAKIKGEINEIAAEMSKKFGAAANINTLGGGKSKVGGNKAEFDALLVATKELEKAKQRMLVLEEQIYAQVVKQKEENQKKLNSYKDQSKRIEQNAKQEAARAESLRRFEERMAETKRKNLSLEQQAEAKLAELKANNFAKNGLSAEKNAELQRKNTENIRIAEEKLQELRNKNSESTRIAELKLQEIKDNNARKNQLAQDKFENTKQRQSEADARRNAASATRAANSTPEAKVDKSSIAAVAKLNAILTSQYTTALEKNDAQMRLNIIEAQKYVVAGDTQNKEYLQLIANTKKLSEENIRLAKASGQTMAAHSSMYGSTYSLTQVMRELPNFAIDARIGFMALSNNLPMLMDDFDRLSKEIDHITGKEKGFKGAFKEFGKSLLSLNTIMIVASTLLVLFGDDIMEFLGNLGKGEKQINRFAEALLKIGNAVSEKSKSNMEEAIKFSVSYYTAVKKGDTERIKQLEDIAAKEYNIHKDRLTQIGENINNWRIAFDEYIKMAQATYFNEMRIKEGAELEYENKKKAAERKKVEDELKTLLESRVKDTPGGMSKQENIDMMLGNLKKGLTTGFIGQAGDLAKRWNELNNEIIESNKQLKALSMINLKPIDMMLDKTLKPEKQKKQKESFNFERTKTEPLKGVNLSSLSVPVDEIKRNELNLGDGMSQSINAMMALNNESYRNGLKSYSDYFKRRKEIYELAAKNEIKIQFDTVEEQAKIDDEHRNRMYENIQQGLDLTFELIRGFYDKYFELLEEEKEKQIKIEDEKIADIEDRERAGIITKQQAEEEKANTASYYAQVDEELERKKKEKEKEAFLLEQAIKLGQVWINFAAAVGSLENMLALGTLTPLYLTQALFSTGLIAAQSIPAFAEGGDMLKDGKALLGDGGKHELAISPSGKMFISDNTPKLYELEKGTHIFPDVNKVDLMSVLAMKQVMPNLRGDNRTEAILQSIDKSIKSQKQGNFYGMPLIRQMNMSQRYYSRKRGLMN